MEYPNVSPCFFPCAFPSVLYEKSIRTYVFCGLTLTSQRASGFFPGTRGNKKGDKFLHPLVLRIID